jgi:hypothetical protein
MSSKFSGILNSTENLSELERNVVLAIQFLSYVREQHDLMLSKGQSSVACLLPTNCEETSKEVLKRYMTSHKIPSDLVLPVVSPFYGAPDHSTAARLLFSGRYSLSQHPDGVGYILSPADFKSRIDCWLLKSAKLADGTYPLHALRGLATDIKLLKYATSVSAPGGEDAKETDIVAEPLIGLQIDPFQPNNCILDKNVIFKARIELQVELTKYEAKRRKEDETQRKTLDRDASQCLSLVVGSLIPPCSDLVKPIVSNLSLTPLDKLCAVYTTLYNHFIGVLDSAHLRVINTEILKDYQLQVSGATHVQRMLELMRLSNSLSKKINSSYYTEKLEAEIFLQILKSFERSHLSITSKLTPFREYCLAEHAKDAKAFAAGLHTANPSPALDFNGSGPITWDRLIRNIDAVRFLDEHGHKALTPFITGGSSYSTLSSGTGIFNVNVPATTVVDKTSKPKPETSPSAPCAACTACGESSHTVNSSKCTKNSAHGSYLAQMAKNWNLKNGKSAPASGTSGPTTVTPRNSSLGCSRCGSKEPHEYKVCTRCTLCGNAGHNRFSCSTSNAVSNTSAVSSATTFKPKGSDFMVSMDSDYVAEFNSHNHLSPQQVFHSMNDTILQSQGAPITGAHWVLCDNGANGKLVPYSTAQSLLVRDELISCTSSNFGIGGSASLIGLAPFIGDILGYNPVTKELQKITFRAPSFQVLSKDHPPLPFDGILGIAEYQHSANFSFKFNSVLQDGIKGPFMRRTTEEGTTHYALLRDKSSPFLFFAMYAKDPKDFTPDDLAFLEYARNLNKELASQWSTAAVQPTTTPSISTTSISAASTVQPAGVFLHKVRMSPITREISFSATDAPAVIGSAKVAE